MAGGKICSDRFRDGSFLVGRSSLERCEICKNWASCAETDRKEKRPGIGRPNDPLVRRDRKRRTNFLILCIPFEHLGRAQRAAKSDRATESQVYVVGFPRPENTNQSTVVKNHPRGLVAGIRRGGFVMR